MCIDPHCKQFGLKPCLWCCIDNGECMISHYAKNIRRIYFTGKIEKESMMVIIKTNYYLQHFRIALMLESPDNIELFDKLAILV
jgi:hypothetical protein